LVDVNNKRTIYMKKISKKAKQKLKKDLEHFNTDLKKITHKKNLIKNKKYLKKMADDIKLLNNDLLITKEDKIPSYIYHMLTTPIGAPFVSNKTLLDAALNFENQSSINSDLCHIISDFSKYENYFNDEIYNIFNSFLKRLKN